MINVCKKRLSILYFAFCVAFLAACTGAPSESPRAYVPLEVADSILESVTFRDNLVLAEGIAAENFYRLDDSIESYAIYISGSGATAEEIAVLKTADVSSGKDAVEILEKRTEDQKKRYEPYQPDEMIKLESPVIVTEGNLAILVLCDDMTQAEEAIKAALD
jgi:hypothetical protein